MDKSSKLKILGVTCFRYLYSCLFSEICWGHAQLLRMPSVDFFKVREMCQSRLDFTTAEIRAEAVGWQVQFAQTAVERAESSE